MSDIVVDTTRYSRLNDQNYAEWSMRTEAVLTRRGLWSSIVNVVLSPSEVANKTESEVAALLQTKLAARPADKLAEARAELILRVESGQLSYMHDSDPREIWLTLRRVHQARGFATTLALKRAFVPPSMRWSVLSLPLGQLEAVDCCSQARRRHSAPKTGLPTHHGLETTPEHNPEP